MSKIFPKQTVVVIVVIVFFILIQHGYYQVVSVSQGVEFTGTDTFMRLVRISEFNDSKSWYDSNVERSNAPFGDELHWSRALDILIYLAALFMNKLIGFTKALTLSGIWISPILGCVSIMVLSWTSKTVLTETSRPMVYLMFLTQVPLLGVFAFGRPDHHSLIQLLFIILVGAIIRLTHEKLKHIYIELTGLVIALSFWISVEAFVLIFMIFTVLSLLWIFYEEDFDIRSFKLARSITLYSIVVLLIERPIKNLMVIEYDKISIVYITFFIIITCIFYLTNKIYLFVKEMNLEVKKGAETNIYRVSILGLLGIIGAAAMVAIFPAFIKGPFANVNSEIVPIWLDRVSEVQPMLSNSYKDIGRTIMYLGIPLMSMVYLLMNNQKDKKVRREYIIIFSTGILLFMVLSLYQIRWVYYLYVISLIPAVKLLEAIVNRVSKIKSLVIAPILRVIVTLVFLFGFTATGFTMMLKYEDPMGSHWKADSVDKICGWMNENESIIGKEQLILAFMDFGPEILYKTNHSIIASPYHRNDEGILFNYNVMTSENESYVKEKLMERHVNWILIAPESTEKRFYNYDELGTTFYKKLVDGISPEWLKEIELPEELHSFKLYEIKL